MVEQEFQKLVGEILVLSNDLEQELGYIKELNLVEQEIKLKNLRLEFIYICEHFINHIRDARLNRLGEPLLGLLRVVNELNTLIKTAQELKTKKYKNCATKKINNLLGIFIKKSSYAILILKELDQKIGVLSQQYYIQVNVAPYKKIRLRIVYEPAIKTAIFLEKKVYFEIADYAKNIGKNINEIISEINKKLENSVKIVFGSDVVESVFGGVFEKNLEIYIIKKYGEKGFVSRLKKAFGRHKDIIEFQPDSNDMRIFFDIQFILNNGSEKIASTLLHELTHVLDKHAFSKTKMWHILYRKLRAIRSEGLAEFAKFTNNPETLSNNKIKFLAKLKKKPYDDAKIIIKELGENKISIIYFLGPVMMVQLFLKKINKTEDDENINAIKKHLENNKKEAIILINHVKLMNYKKFFEYYLNNIEKPIFTKEFVNKVVLVGPSD